MQQYAKNNTVNSEIIAWFYYCNFVILDKIRLLFTEKHPASFI